MKYPAVQPSPLQHCEEMDRRTELGRDIAHTGASGEAASAKFFIQADFDIFLFTFRILHIEMSPVNSAVSHGEEYYRLISINLS